MERTLEHLRPGLTCEEVEARWRSIMEEGGYRKEARIGYAIGIGFPPGWGENTYSLRAGDRTVLDPGMTFHFNLGMWGKGVNYSISETILMTERGSETLTPFPRRLFTDADS